MDSILYLSVHNGHTGETVRIPRPVRFHTLVAFKSHILEVFRHNDPDSLFLLASFGIKLNFNLINEIADVFVFDKRMFSPEFDPGSVQSSPALDVALAPKPFNEEVPTKTTKITTSLKVNQGWLQALLQDSYTIDRHIKLVSKHINTIFKSLNVMFQFCTNFIAGIEKNFASFFNYIKLLSIKSLSASWNDHLRKLLSFPAVGLKHSNKVVLSKLLNQERLQSAANYVSENLPLVVDKFNEMSAAINDVNDEKVAVDEHIESLRKESISKFKNSDSTCKSLLQSISDACHEINSDLSSLSTLWPEVYARHKQISVTAHENAAKLLEQLHNFTRFKQSLASASIKIFQTIASLQMKMVTVRTELKAVTTEGEENAQISFKTVQNIKQSEDYLSLTVDLPLLFGFIIIEKRRQYEWYDFYSKGVVNTLSEQLAVIIDQEKLFQTLWLKKFNNFIKFITDDDSRVAVPNLDITLVNNNFDALEVFSILRGQIDREDILNYIKLLKENIPNGDRFVELLEKNFKDLVKSTENMQKVTKLVSSLSSFTSPDNNNLEVSKIHTSSDFDVDFNVIKGLKTRIKKLENLLHQQQYTNINNWPVVRSQDNTKMSMILSSPKTPTPDRKIEAVKPASDPTKLLQRRLTTNSPRSFDESKVMDASTTIDKHLLNIRLQKENADLLNKNGVLSQQNSSNEALISKLKSELSELKSSQSSKDDEIVRLRRQLTDKDEEITFLKSQVLDKDLSLKNLKKELVSSDLTEKVKQLEQKLEDSNNMKTDLLSNMASKESGYVKERNGLENEIKLLRSKVEELHEDYENLMELTQAKHKHNGVVIDEMNSVISELFKRIRALVLSNYDYVLEFCYTLETMGLLLVNEYNENKQTNEYKITRVKGLKSKRNDSFTEEVEDGKLQTKVLAELFSKMKFADTLVEEDSDVKSINTSLSEHQNDNDLNEETQSQRLVSKFNRAFGDAHNDFDEFMKFVSFKENVHITTLESENHENRFFLNAISKRFRDVEGFAKKLSKDNKVKVSEINRLLDKSRTNITISNFEIGDLVLFLPTKVENENYQEEVHPWAAFNVGSPHYFLKGNVDREWMVGKVTKIEEKKVTAENEKDEVENPFRLSVGVMWFLVEAEGTDQ